MDQFLLRFFKPLEMIPENFESSPLRLLVILDSLPIVLRLVEISISFRPRGFITQESLFCSKKMTCATCAPSLILLFQPHTDRRLEKLRKYQSKKELDIKTPIDILK